MISEITFLGFTFHLYGLILGGAIILALQISYIQLTNSYTLSESLFYNAAFFTLLASIIGARAWHVATDYGLYLENPVQVFFIWNGGLSIFGAFLFGGLALWQLQKRSLKAVPILALFDGLALGIPFGQALGRWGNFVNQEALEQDRLGQAVLFIDVSHRLPGFEQVTYYHPLFLYESMGMFLFGIFLWDKKDTWQLGSGKLFLSMISFYSFFRFLLDFLRLEKEVFFLQMGINQIALICFLFLLLLYLQRKNYVKKK